MTVYTPTHTQAGAVEIDADTPVQRTDVMKAGISTSPETMDGCTVYTLSDMNPNDFETFLKYLDMPFEHSISSASVNTLITLLRTSDALACKSMLELSKKHIVCHYSSASPPPPATLTSRKLLRNALNVLPLARKHSLSGVLKHAFYELLRSKGFWKQSGSYALSDTDLLRLHEMRWELRKWWDALLHEPPQAHVGGSCAECTPHSDNGGAMRAWKVDLVLDSGLVSGEAECDGKDWINDTGFVLNWLTSMKGKGRWCDHCLDERHKAWKEARAKWWKDLDRWLRADVPGTRMSS